MKNDETFRHSDENVNLSYILTVVELNCMLEPGKPVRRVNDYIGVSMSCLCFYLCLNIATFMKVLREIIREKRKFFLKRTSYCSRDRPPSPSTTDKSLVT